MRSYRAARPAPVALDVLNVTLIRKVTVSFNLAHAVRDVNHLDHRIGDDLHVVELAGRS